MDADSRIVQKISDQITKYNLLVELTNALARDFNLVVVIGAEIEFYLTSEYSGGDECITKEKGVYQYEINVEPVVGLEEAVHAVVGAMTSLTTRFPDSILSPKPFKHDYGSAMHFHVNFIDIDSGSNYFDNEECITLAASALCHYLPETFFVFAQDEECYDRYSGMMAPTHVSWGGNNRSVAVRIPDSKPRRIEHRVSSPMTRIDVAIFTIVQSIYLGLKSPKSIKKYDKIYGNAFDSQYKLARLPTSPKEAFNLLNVDFYSQLLQK